MNKIDILTGFNNHIVDFFNDVLTIFPNDTEISVAHSSLIAIRKVNPRLIVTIWKQYISDPYTNQIQCGDINFFINRDYSTDLKDSDKATTILQKIDTLREPIKLMGDDNKKKTIDYIQNLTKLCNLYHS